MRVLVIGGTGGTGQEVVRQAVAAGHTVTALVRNAATAAKLLPGATLVPGNVLDPACLERAADGQIDPGDPIAILDDIDCNLNDVQSGLTVTLKNVDLLFSSAPVADCTDTNGSPPAKGRARADTITQRKATTTTTLR